MNDKKENMNKKDNSSSNTNLPTPTATMDPSFNPLVLSPAMHAASEPATLKAYWLSYWARVRWFQERMNPCLLFASPADIRRAKEIAELFEAGAKEELQKRNIKQEEIDKALKLRDSSVNRSNGQLLPIPLRMSAYAPVNIPICAGLLLTAPTVGNSIFWQWVNQTYNAAFNYANGNQLQDERKQQQQQQNIIKGYSAAVVVSVGLAVGLNAWVARLKGGPLIRRLLQGSVPFASVAAANVANVFLMRGQECFTGIPVYSPEGRLLGTSKRAGFEAVLQTAISRIVLPVPVLLFPGPIISFFNFMLPWTRSSSFLKVFTQLSVVYGCLNLGLPLAVGIFPSVGRLSTGHLEAEFQDLADEKGNKITHVLFNRGV